MNREDIANKCISQFKNNNKLLLQLPTGTGKSLIAIKMIETVKTDNILILCAEIAHINNWKDEFNKWNKQYLLKKCTIITYASLHKVQGHYSIIIADEVHHLVTEKRMGCFNNLQYDYFIGLSANIGKRIIDLQELFNNELKLINMNLKEAITNNILANPKVIAHGIDLSLIKESFEIVKTRGKLPKIVIYSSYEDMWKYIRDRIHYPNLELHVKCTALQKYNDLCEEQEYWKRNYLRDRTLFKRNKWLQTANIKKKFLGELKTFMVTKFIRKHFKDDDRFICFCNSINQQTDIIKELKLKNQAINSTILNNDEIINDYNNKKFNSLFCVEMLTEGQNLVDTPTCIIIQLDAEIRRFIQKVGRALRHKSPSIYIFYIKNTRDEEFLEEATKYIPDIKKVLWRN